MFICLSAGHLSSMDDAHTPHHSHAHHRRIIQSEWLTTIQPDKAVLDTIKTVLNNLMRSLVDRNHARQGPSCCWCVLDLYIRWCASLLAPVRAPTTSFFAVKKPLWKRFDRLCDIGVS